jgi:Asp-tRNA(Asn)/Glu-tRNA(Gln) amidotransferase A subunit family amidase
MAKSKAKDPRSILGVAWYKPEQWETLSNASVDKDDLEKTHAEWLTGAERAVKQLRQQGYQVVKVDVDIFDLMLWCESQKIPLDGEARIKYTTFKLQQLSK